MPYKAFEKDGEWCVYKHENDQRVGKTFGCHPSIEEANEQIRALYSQENLSTEFVYLPNEFMSYTPGKPIRLLPIGRLVKNGKVRELTTEFLKKFRLPHFKPPIKLGSHDDATRAGGVISGLEVRDDGLYGVPEFTEAGQEVFDRGDYNYQSPEIIWEDGGYEDPQTGETISGPMVVGVALLHTPHLGQLAALYSFQITEEKMALDTVEVPKTFWEGLLARFDRKDDTEPEPGNDAPNADEFAAIVKERDELAAKIAEQETQKSRQDMVAGIVSNLKGEKFGKHFEDDEFCVIAANHLADMTQDQRDWVIGQFASLTGQIKESELFGEKGSTGDGADDDAVADIDRRVKAVMQEKGVNYTAALKIVFAENPELYNRAY